MKTFICAALLAIAGTLPFVASRMMLHSVWDTGEQYNYQYSSSEQYFDLGEVRSLDRLQSTNWSDYGVDVDSLSVDAGYVTEY